MTIKLCLSYAVKRSQPVPWQNFKPSNTNIKIKNINMHHVPIQIQMKALAIRMFSFSFFLCVCQKQTSCTFSGAWRASGMLLKYITTIRFFILLLLSIQSDHSSVTLDEYIIELYHICKVCTGYWLCLKWVYLCLWIATVSKGKAYTKLYKYK